MPNHCNNSLSIKFNSVEAKKSFVTKHCVAKEDTILDFNTIIPMPEELVGTTSPTNLSAEKQAELVKKYGFSDWYDWSIENWGTKWNSYDGFSNDMDEDSDTLGLVFDTAWEPPEKIIHALIEMYPDVSFEFQYDEPGMGFGGEIKGYNGEVTETIEVSDDEYIDWSSDYDVNVFLENRADDFNVSWDNDDSEKLTIALEVRIPDGMAKSEAMLTTFGEK